MLSATHKLLIYIGRCGHLPYTFAVPPAFSTSPIIDSTPGQGGS
jgi:hypothetical protein